MIGICVEIREAMVENTYRLCKEDDGDYINLPESKAIIETIKVAIVWP